MKVCVYGLWHLGLVTIAGLLQTGHTVIGLDSIDLTLLNKGQIPFHEPGISDAIITGLKHKNVFFTNNPKTAITNSDIIWVTFDTSTDNNNISDTAYIEEKIINIAPYLKNQVKLIISSQIPVKFTEKTERYLSAKYPYKKIFVAYSPENLQLGNALKRFTHPDRIIIGVHPEEKPEFEPFFTTITHNLIWMTILSAEMVKHAINAYLATSICITNEIAQICNNVGALSGEVELGMKSDTRIGQQAYVRSGNAYSGSTLARDIQSLHTIIEQSDIIAPIISSIPVSNNDHINWIYKIISNNMNNMFYNKHILVIGLTYKNGTSIIKQSNALKLCEWLYQQGSIIYAYDPLVTSDCPRYINLIYDLNYIPIHVHCVIILKNIFDKSILEMITKKNTIIIDPDGYLQPKKNGGRYFSVRRL